MKRKGRFERKKQKEKWGGREGRDNLLSLELKAIRRNQPGVNEACTGFRIRRSGCVFQLCNVTECGLKIRLSLNLSVCAYKMGMVRINLI